MGSRPELRCHPGYMGPAWLGNRRLMGGSSRLEPGSTVSTQEGLTPKCRVSIILCRSPPKKNEDKKSASIGAVHDVPIKSNPSITSLSCLPEEISTVKKGSAAWAPGACVVVRADTIDEAKPVNVVESLGMLRVAGARGAVPAFQWVDARACTYEPRFYIWATRDELVRTKSSRNPSMASASVTGRHTCHVEPSGMPGQFWRGGRSTVAFLRVEPGRHGAAPGLLLLTWHSRVLIAGTRPTNRELANTCRQISEYVSLNFLRECPNR